MIAPAITDALKSAKRGLRLVRTAKLARPVDPPPERAARTGAAPGLRGATVPAAVRPLGAGELTILQALLPYESAEPLAGRLEKGDRCWGVFAEAGAPSDGSNSRGAGAGGVEAFVWCATGRTVYVDELGAHAYVPSSTAYVYELYTFPQARGRGHAKALLRAVASDLARERGGGTSGTSPRNLEAWVGEWNEPSLRAFRSLGFEPYDGGWRLAALGPLRLLRGSVGFLGASSARPGQGPAGDGCARASVPAVGGER